ncbi:MAG: LysM peptidoglycan-binding domain-containing protein [Desulfobacteraceae bacterium]|nr:MAG: LysM peptidoglycan-binding domain-containing protein [Desulfobacteraceae bacterium]
MNQVTEIKSKLKIPNRKQMGIVSMKIRTRCRTLGPMLLLISWVLFAATPSLTAADETNATPIDYEAGFYYTVKEGDTLWDLSQRFSDTPWQWPDLWRENKQLPNPHWIYPGERIRLFRKTEQHRVSEPPSKEIPMAAPQAEASTPSKEAQPVIEFLYSNIDQVGFIRKPAVQPLGTIIKCVGDKRLISKGDIVYLRYNDSSSAEAFAPGTRMTVYRTLQPTDDPKSITTIGTQHLLVGLIELTKNEADFAVAKVMKSYRAILLEDLVMAYDSKKPYMPVVDSTQGIDGQIIAGENHSKLLGDYFIAFIDKGIQDNILPGQIYNIYKQEKATVAALKGGVVDLERIYCGSVFVLHTEQTTSTVVINHNIQKITPGERFQTP